MGDEKHVRQRKKAKSATTKKHTKFNENARSTKVTNSASWNLGWYSNAAVGLVVMFLMASNFSWLLYTLHENHFWFTNIKEVEREISFRTESGLYYSYYKQMVEAPSIQTGLYELTHDNLTEHQVTMNVLQRMNIYQEVFLGVVYKTFPSIKETFGKPVFFYIKAIHGLHGGLLCCVYLLSWYLSGSWLAGVLSAAFYVFSKDDTTRVSFVIPLRESFSLPYLWGQLLCISVYLRPKSTSLQRKLSMLGIIKCTFLFSLFWQFNQFVLLLQAMALFGTQVLQLVPHEKIRKLYYAQIFSLLGVSVLQYFNTMIIVGPVFCFIPAALVVMFIQGERPSSSGVFFRIIKLIVYILLVFALMISFMKLIKLIIEVDSDEHIYKFVLHKFGITHSKDFDVSLYICNGAFTFLTTDTFYRLTKTFVFPLYVIAHVTGILCLVCGVVQKWRYESSYKKDEDEDGQKDYFFKHCPELAYHLIQTFFFGALAITTLRMKYLWTPYMCILASLPLCHPAFYGWVLRKLGKHSKVLVELVRHLVTAAVLGALIYQCLPKLQKELDDLQEFYDPDTVELMEWINAKTLPGEAFSGSMQLLAGVKLCTGRPVTNHPHYEDKLLRKRTRELYLMYAKEDPENVHSIMVKHNATYIILEDSICLSRRERCSLPTILDIDMGMIPENPESVSDISDLQPSDKKRFCDEVRYMKAPYNKYFKKVFNNKTFRIYKVLV